MLNEHKRNYGGYQKITTRSRALNMGVFTLGIILKMNDF
jgi:hypothetical protein